MYRNALRRVGDEYGMPPEGTTVIETRIILERHNNVPAMSAMLMINGVEVQGWDSNDSDTE